MSERIVIKDLEKALKNLEKINPVHKNHLIRYMFARDLIKPGEQVADVACGSGYGSKMLGQHGCHVTGVDISEKAVNLANKHNHHENVEFCVGSIYQLSDLFSPKSLDAFVSFETLEHLEKNHKQILQGIKATLKPGCPAICSIPLNHPDKRWHKKIFSFSEREYLFKSVFSTVEYSPKNKSIIVGWP
jgi:2-polyprenyl-3-methyl-5-hydroxy-6-metoxy-1,4-benzoquinol methylase